jgi:hypothetical protein
MQAAKAQSVEINGILLSMAAFLPGRLVAPREQLSRRPIRLQEDIYMSRMDV